jgi:hypothetical protein
MLYIIKAMHVFIFLHKILQLYECFHLSPMKFMYSSAKFSASGSNVIFKFYVF